ncbi:MAG TPA: class I SAM-dependent methyltransferase [Pyrinomonadaceae bacterium]|nr:class I SAM-dependent methyltransferase [Pyrinomonadaceae bacterium]
MYSEHSRMATVSEFAEKRVREIVSDFLPYRKTGEFLDIGSGAGSLLTAAAENGWNATGTEVSDSAVKALRDRGYNVFHGFLADAGFEAERFDVVTASEVIEHVDEPLEFVKYVYTILRPGGLFWLTTPHGNGVASRLLHERWSQVEPPVHLHLFTRRGLETLLNRVGFGTVKVYSQGVNPYEIFYNLRHKVDTENQHNHLKDQLDFKDAVELNASFSQTGWKRSIKNAANGTLRMLNIGDSLKATAIK